MPVVTRYLSAALAATLLLLAYATLCTAPLVLRVFRDLLVVGQLDVQGICMDQSGSRFVLF